MTTYLSLLRRSIDEQRPVVWLIHDEREATLEASLDAGISLIRSLFFGQRRVAAQSSRRCQLRYAFMRAMSSCFAPTAPG